jgi:UDP-3-O-[3-hydroxymyristoyl] glucosamine N-acyltransferase
MGITIGKIADLLDADIPHHVQDYQITGINILDQAKPGEISFFSNDRYRTLLNNTSASAVIVGKDEPIADDIKWIAITVEDVYHALAKILTLFSPPSEYRHKVSKTAIVRDDSNIHERSYIGHHVVIQPGAAIAEGAVIMGNNYVGKNAKIGANTILYPGVVLLDDCIIGENCIIHANTVIGSDGFGYVFVDNRYQKIPQIGNVIIEDHVEIGSNCSIDRASIGSTLIKKGAKLDNLIQIAHNVKIGENSAIAAQAGIAGSTTLGDYCQVGGQAGIVGHLTISSMTKIQAQSGVTRSVTKEGSKLYGYPAIEYNNYLRSYAGFKNLPELLKRVKDLENQVNSIKKEHESKDNS